MCADAALPHDWPEGVGRLILAEVDSTMAEAARRAPQRAGPVWILGLRQTNGRGRRGRPWMDPPGNFAATLLMYPTGPAGTAALRSFVAALALFDALAAVAGRDAGLALKWPNDVLMRDGKLAGILLESAGSGGPVAHLAVGIGVNLSAAPDPQSIEPGALRPTSLLAETGAQVTPEGFLDRLAPAFARWEARLAAEGFGPVRDAWLARAARLGQPITARIGSETVAGRFDTVDDTGALVLATGQGRRALAAAEVHF